MKSRSFLVGVLLLTGFFCLPAANAAYQDTKAGTLTIRIVIPERVPAVSAPTTSDSPSAAEAVVPSQSTTTSAVVTTTSPPQQSAEPSASEAPTPTSTSTEEKEVSSVPVAP